jgi:hypothetical protein
MRHVRITVGIVAAVMCVFGAFAAGPAFAKEKKAPIFGKFTASRPAGEPITPEDPATANGLGQIDKLNLAGGGLLIEGCRKEAKTSGSVVAESSETLLQNITYKKCIATIRLASSGLSFTQTVPTFHLAMEFHSNHTSVIGEAEEENLTIVKPSSLSVRIGKTPCVVTIPAQTVPVKSKPTKEYEAAGYETELLKVKHKQLKTFPSGFQEGLYIEWEFNKLKSLVKPNAKCAYKGGALNENPESPNFGYVVYSEGVFEGEIEGITIPNGNIGFEPKPEA